MTYTTALKSTIEPKSDQLNADDLLIGPITTTITGIREGPSPEQPVEIDIDGHRPYRPCKSMRRVLIMAWGDNGHEWIGRSMTLYCDPDVKFGGIALGGIRISHVSHIEKPISMMLTTTRARRAAYKVEPIKKNPPYPGDKFETNLPIWRKAIEEKKVTAEGIIAKVSATWTLTETQREKINEA